MIINLLHKIYTFNSKNAKNCVRVLISLLYHIYSIRSHCFKHNTPILFLSCRIWIKCFINQIILRSCKNSLCFSEWKCWNNSGCMCSSTYCAFLSLIWIELPFFQRPILDTRNNIWETVIMNLYMKTVLNH